MSERVTLRDVAAAAAVSVATASMALAGHPRITTKSRDAVVAAAVRLGYHRDPALSSLASGRFRHAGKPPVIATWIDDDALAEGFRHKTSGMGMMAVPLPPKSIDLSIALAGIGATALVVHRRQAQADVLSRLPVHAILWLDEGHPPPYPCDLIETHEWWTSTLGAVACVREAGYRQPAVITRPAQPRHWQDDVRTAAARSLGLPVLEWDLEPAPLLDFLRHEHPDAVVGGTVEVHARLRGLAIDMPFAALMVPDSAFFSKVTGWRHDQDGRYQATLELIEHRMRYGPRLPRRIIIPPRWLAGSSLSRR
jgi:hypothetical protein